MELGVAVVGALLVAVVGGGRCGSACDGVVSCSGSCGGIVLGSCFKRKVWRMGGVVGACAGAVVTAVVGNLVGFVVGAVAGG